MSSWPIAILGLGGLYMLTMKKSASTTPTIPTGKVDPGSFPLGPPGVPGYTMADVEAATIVKEVDGVAIRFWKDSIAIAIRKALGGQGVELVTTATDEDGLSWAVYAKVSGEGSPASDVLKAAESSGQTCVTSLSWYLSPSTEEDWIVPCRRSYTGIAQRDRRFAVLALGSGGRIKPGRIDPKVDPPVPPTPDCPNTATDPSESDLDAHMPCLEKREVIRIAHDKSISAEDVTRAGQVCASSGYPRAAAVLFAESARRAKTYRTYTIKGNGDVPWIVACKATGVGIRYRELLGQINPELKESPPGYVNPWKVGQIVRIPDSWDPAMGKSCPEAPKPTVIDYDTPGTDIPIGPNVIPDFGDDFPIGPNVMPGTTVDPDVYDKYGDGVNIDTTDSSDTGIDDAVLRPDTDTSDSPATWPWPAAEADDDE